MKASLEVVAGNDLARRIELRDGQVAQFGRTDWADFAFRGDAAMAEVHFAVECRPDGCRLIPLATDRDTLLNGEKTDEAVLHTGDRITAGRTTLAVTIEGEAAPPPAPASAEPADADRPPATDFVGVCTFLELADALPNAQADPSLSRDAFLAQLVVQKKFLAAARLYAHWLPKPAAVWWGCLCVREAYGPNLPPDQQPAAAAAEQWVARRDEPSRRRAETAFASANYTGAGGMLAAAAFGAGDNIAPPDSATPVPPDPRLTGHCVRTALVFASVAGDARLAPTRWQMFLALAQDCLTGKIKPPEAS